VLRLLSQLNNGEACIAQTRILAPRSRYEEVVAALKELVESLKVGDPNDPDTFIGPMVRPDQQQRVRDYIELGIKEGARLVTGGPHVPPGLEGGNYVTPTVFADVDNSMRIAQEEIFGPVLVVIAYDDEDDAVRIANDSEYGLSGGVWSADRAHATRGRPPAEDRHGHGQRCAHRLRRTVRRLQGRRDRPGVRRGRALPVRRAQDRHALTGAARTGVDHERPRRHGRLTRSVRPARNRPSGQAR
jgi:hypothetical protein